MPPWLPCWLLSSGRQTTALVLVLVFVTVLVTVTAAEYKMESLLIFESCWRRFEERYGMVRAAWARAAWSPA